MEKIKLSTKKIAIIIIGILLTIILIILVRKVIIFNFISSKIEDYTQSTNFYRRSYMYQGWNASTTELWVKDGNAVCKYDHGSMCIIQDNVLYEVFDNSIIHVSKSESDIKEFLNSTWNRVKLSQDELRDLKSIFKYSLSTAKVNGKKCYKLVDKDGILYFEKETGLLIRNESFEGLISGYQYEEIQSTLGDYKYEFNNVKDEDVQVDISNFSNSI